EAAGFVLGVGHEITGVLDPTGGDTGGLEGLLGDGGGTGGAPFAEALVDLHASGEAAGGAGEIGIGGEVGDAPADGLAQSHPFVVGAARDGQLDEVAAAVDVVRRPLAKGVDVAGRLGLT